MSVRTPTTPLDRKIAFYSPVLRASLFALRYWGTWTALLVLSVLAPLPLVVTRAAGSVLGAIMLVVNRKRRRIARINLRLCFAELPSSVRRRLLWRHFVVYGQSLTDIIHLAWSSQRRLRRMTKWRGLEAYRQYTDEDRSVVLLVPHLVGMNFSGAMLAYEHPTFCIVKPLRNEVLDWFLHRARTRFGAHVLQRSQGLRPAIRALEQGCTFHYSPDEDLGPKHSVFAPFFGVATATLPTLGRIAKRCNAVVIPCFVRLVSWGRGYEVMLQPPLENFPTGSETEDAGRMNRAIEDGVRAIPEQYLWTFKLFKTRPPGERPLYP